LLYISHDRYFINNTATKVLDLTPSGLVSYAGNYDYYVDKKAALLGMNLLQVTAPSKTTARPSIQKEDYQRKKEQDAAARRKKNRIDKLEAEIANTETQIAECDTKMANDETARNAELLQQIFAQKTELEHYLATLYEEWGEIA